MKIHRVDSYSLPVTICAVVFSVVCAIYAIYNIGVSLPKYRYDMTLRNGTVLHVPSGCFYDNFTFERYDLTLNGIEITIPYAFVQQVVKVKI